MEAEGSLILPRVETHHTDTVLEAECKAPIKRTVIQCIAGSIRHGNINMQDLHAQSLPQIWSPKRYRQIRSVKNNNLTHVTGRKYQTVHVFGFFEVCL